MLQISKITGERFQLETDKNFESSFSHFTNAITAYNFLNTKMADFVLTAA